MEGLAGSSSDFRLRCSSFCGFLFPLVNYTFQFYLKLYSSVCLYMKETSGNKNQERLLWGERLFSEFLKLWYRGNHKPSWSFTGPSLWPGPVGTGSSGSTLPCLSEWYSYFSWIAHSHLTFFNSCRSLSKPVLGRSLWGSGFHLQMTAMNLENSKGDYKPEALGDSKFIIHQSGTPVLPCISSEFAHRWELMAKNTGSSHPFEDREPQTSVHLIHPSGSSCTVVLFPCEASRLALDLYGEQISGVHIIERIPTRTAASTWMRGCQVQ